LAKLFKARQGNDQGETRLDVYSRQWKVMTKVRLG
jgi:hypothetical protein